MTTSDPNKPTDWGNPNENEDYHTDESSRYHVPAEKELDERLEWLKNESDAEKASNDYGD